MSLLQKMRKIRSNQLIYERKGLTLNGKTKQEALSVYGYSGFRPGQEEILDEVLAGKDGVLGVMATGYGKSALFQIPALMTTNLTIVVSPLISLMKDQVDAMQKIGVGAGFINSTQTKKQQEEVISDTVAGKYVILYVSPERFKNDDFMRIMRGLDIGLFAVDEAHVCSQWGHDFRPAYAKLGEVIKEIKPEQVIALTATATDRVKEDVCNLLGIPDAKCFVRGVKRDNLEICIFDDSGMSRDAAIFEGIKDYPKGVTGIIYVASRTEANQLSKYLTNKGIKSSFYHAGMKQKERKEMQEAWAQNGGIVVATSAFGMGIDRADVRFVIHSGFTGSIEAWYQECGRAGRDGKDSCALSLYNVKDDYHIQSFLIGLTNPEEDEVKKFWRWLFNHAMVAAKPDAKTVTVNMTQKEMANLSRSRNVGACIGFLKRQELVKTIGRGKYQVSLEKKPMDFEKLNSQRKENFDKLHSLIRFYQSKRCRYAQICEYFGDDTFTGRCGNCDNCQ